jgi:hypothetical protein
MFPVKKDVRPNNKVKIKGGLSYEDIHMTWVFRVAQTVSGKEE